MQDGRNAIAEWIKAVLPIKYNAKFMNPRLFLFVIVCKHKLAIFFSKDELSNYYQILFCRHIVRAAHACLCAGNAAFQEFGRNRRD